jgi:hypothetical protein
MHVHNQVPVLPSFVTILKEKRYSSNPQLGDSTPRWLLSNVPCMAYLCANVTKPAASGFNGFDLQLYAPILLCSKTADKMKQWDSTSKSSKQITKRGVVA